MILANHLHMPSYCLKTFTECPYLKRAENETRTRDPNLGKVMLYQLSYFRMG